MDVASLQIYSGQFSTSISDQSAESVGRQVSFDAALYARSSSLRDGLSLARTASSMKALIRFGGSSFFKRR